MEPSAMRLSSSSSSKSSSFKHAFGFLILSMIRPGEDMLVRLSLLYTFREFAHPIALHRHGRGWPEWT
eukprot:8898232-Ditylum_brightwellii.AAC.1